MYHLGVFYKTLLSKVYIGLEVLSFFKAEINVLSWVNFIMCLVPNLIVGSDFTLVSNLVATGDSKFNSHVTQFSHVGKFHVF